MAWTAPATWSVSELVTASKMNTHVRDNLAYLKGQAGTVAIENAMTVAGQISPTSATNVQLAMASTASILGYLGMQTTSQARWDVNRNPNSGTFDDTAKSHARIGIDGAGTASFIAFSTANAANTIATERMRIIGDGKVGIGRTVPQGIIHSYNTISGFLLWEFDGLDGTARTVIPDGAGDVLYGLALSSIVRSSGGTVQALHGFAGTTWAPGTTPSIYSNGADIVVMTVAANGSVTVQRTGGALTYKVSLMLQWL